MTAPLFKYPGSKWRLAAHYPKPAHDRVIETCAGSACYSLRNACRSVLLIETNPRVADLWRFLIDAKPSDILSLPVAFEIGEDLRDVGYSLGLDPSAVELIKCWQRSGRQSCYTVSKWSNSMPGYWSEAIKQRIVETLPLIRGWTVLHKSCLDFEAPPKSSATWFVDPPYQKVKDDLYKSPPVDFTKLGKWCRSRPGQVIVCEQQGADWLPFRPLRTVRNMRGHEYTEMVWTNDDPPKRGVFLKVGANVT